MPLLFATRIYVIDDAI